MTATEPRPAPDGGSVITDTDRKRRVALWVVPPVAVVLAVLLVLMATSDPASERAADSPLLGELAPAITGTTTDGEAFDLDDHRGEWVVVNFFSTTCVPCIVEHPELVSFHEANSPAGRGTVVSVAFDDSADNVTEFFADNGGDWAVLAEDTGQVAVRWGVTGVPESYLVAPSGVVASKIIGGVERSYLEDRIAELEASAEAALAGSGQAP